MAGVSSSNLHYFIYNTSMDHEVEVFLARKIWARFSFKRYICSKKNWARRSMLSKRLYLVSLKEEGEVERTVNESRNISVVNDGETLKKKDSRIPSNTVRRKQKGLL